MKRTVLVCCVLFPAVASAQSDPVEERVIIDETFQDNRNNWGQFDNELNTSRVERHILYVENKTDRGTYNSTNVRIPENEDYTIEATVRLARSTDTYGFGIAFGMRDTSNGLFFLLRKDGYYGFYEQYATNWKGTPEWTQTTAIRTGVGATNTLTIRKVGSRFYLDVNGTNIDRVPVIAFKGQYLGFHVGGHQVMEVERIKVVSYSDAPAPVAAKAVAPPVPEPKPAVAPEPKPEPAKAKPKVVAVFDVEDSSNKSKRDMLGNLAEYLAALLVKKGSYSIVPREQMRERLGTAKANTYKACYDSACQIDLGKALAAEAIVTTKILRIGNVCAITTTLFDLKTETTLRAATAESGCSEEKLLGSMRTVSEQL